MGESWRSWEYDFPPFFTLQPVDKTRLQQISGWSKVILAFCQAQNISSIDVNSSLFKNDKINRSLSSSDIHSIFEALVASGQLKCAHSGDKSKVIVLWKSISGWADTIYRTMQLALPRCLTLSMVMTQRRNHFTSKATSSSVKHYFIYNLLEKPKCFTTM